MKNWPPRNLLAVGKNNVQLVPNVDHNKIFIPQVHIKLGLMKQFVVAMDQTNSGFQYLKGKFRMMKTDAKLKAGVFIGP